MRLFKYFHPDRTDVLRTAMIRFSSPRTLNDPFELKPHIEGLVRRPQIDADFAAMMPKVLAQQYAELSPAVRALLPLTLVRTHIAEQLPNLASVMEALLAAHLPQLREMVSQNFAEMIGVLCLTESPANLLMWAHYADSHQGFVVEFDPTAQFLTNVWVQATNCGTFGKSATLMSVRPSSSRKWRISRRS